MRKPVTFTIAATAAAAAATIGIGITAASAAPAASRAASGTESIQVMSASTGPGPASVIARGVFTAAGQVRLGDAKAATIMFPGGTITLNHEPAHGSQHFSPASCLSLVSQAGRYQITRGTGRYAGVSGHGTYRLSLEMVGARVHGRCSSGRPLAEQELLQLSGPVRL